MAEEVLEWLEDRKAYRAVCDDLTRLKERIARPGACARAAEVLLSMAAPEAHPLQPVGVSQ